MEATGQVFLLFLPFANILEAHLLFLKVSIGKCQDWAEKMVNHFKSL